jgi:uncharacterized protein (TIGR03435 family)
MYNASHMIELFRKFRVMLEQMRLSSLLACLLTFAIGSSWAAPPAFEVASVKGMKEVRGGVRLQVEPGSLTMRNVTLRTCIRWAYGVGEYQVNGPNWINSERYEIIAKAAGPAPDSELRLMLQALLAERFQLKLHHDSKTLSVYVLTVVKGGPRFQESTGEGEASIQQGKKGPIFGVTGQHIPLSQVTDMLSRILQAPVLDQTGLTGKYDMTIDPSAYITHDEAGQPKMAGGMEEMMNALFTGLKDQLGLKLDAKKEAMEMFIVDSAQRVPSEN